MKLQWGNVFTPICHSVHRGQCLPQCILGYTPPKADPHWADPPWPDTTPHQQMATAADSVHPTGMHSCFMFKMHS